MEHCKAEPNLQAQLAVLQSEEIVEAAERIDATARRMSGAGGGRRGSIGGVSRNSVHRQMTAATARRKATWIGPTRGRRGSLVGGIGQPGVMMCKSFAFVCDEHCLPQSCSSPRFLRDRVSDLSEKLSVGCQTEPEVLEPVALRSSSLSLQACQKCC